MKKPIRRVKPPKNDEDARDRVQAIEHARNLIRKAIAHLRPCAPAAASYVARALKSVDGAARHAAHWQYRETRRDACRHPEYYTINEGRGYHRCLSRCGFQFQDERRPARPWNGRPEL
jgi:hypothetical protein